MGREHSEGDRLMTLYVPLEVPLVAVAVLAGYLVLGLGISVTVYRDQRTRRPWKLSHWVSAITSGPLVMAELLLEQWLANRQARRRRK